MFDKLKDAKVYLVTGFEFYAGLIAVEGEMRRSFAPLPCS